MNEFDAFDPLKAKSTNNTEAATNALKREIVNILGSYVGWFDPFCELIQNSLDSVEERATQSKGHYVPSIWITINIEKNYLIVTDNGVGLDKKKFEQFLAPDFSFKSGKTRGHKGVGATYLAYGFNHIQICTKSGEFSTRGKMLNARKWLDDANPAGNPEVSLDSDPAFDPAFESIDNGVSIYLKFDETTHPKALRYMVSDEAVAWLNILSVKTGLGAFHKNSAIFIQAKVFDKEGKESIAAFEGIQYLWPHTVVSKSCRYKDMETKMAELFKRKGEDFVMPSSMTNLEMFWDFLSTEELKKRISLSEDELLVLNRYQPEIYFAYAYSLKVWQSFNESLKIRGNVRILYGGIQIAANNMPQGELIQIPLNRNIGRQNQVHILIHFQNCSADLGRKGFQSEIVDFSKEVAKKLVDGPLQKMKRYLKQNTGAPMDLVRSKQVDDWKDEMTKHETDNPLALISDHFFLPLKKISITSHPTREQDVIALFNQLLAGGVIRGIRIMSTNERLTYDGLCKVVIEEPKEHHLYNKDTNPLGISKDVMDQVPLPLISKAKILEYKYSLDGLIEDIEGGDKNSNEIDLVVVWETGDEYPGSYKITSFLDPNNTAERQYHGVTHVMTNLKSGQREMDLIVLKELIDFLNNPATAALSQAAKYDSD